MRYISELVNTLLIYASRAFPPKRKQFIRFIETDLISILNCYNDTQLNKSFETALVISVPKEWII